LNIGIIAASAVSLRPLVSRMLGIRSTAYDGTSKYGKSSGPGGTSKSRGARIASMSMARNAGPRKLDDGWEMMDSSETSGDRDSHSGRNTPGVPTISVGEHDLERGGNRAGAESPAGGGMYKNGGAEASGSQEMILGTPSSGDSTGIMRTTEVKVTVGP